MARRATLAHCLMFKHKWPALRRVAFRASIRFRRVRERSAVHRVALVWIVAIAATHLPFDDGMVMWETELRALIKVTLETSVRRFFWIQDRVVRFEPGFAVVIENVRAVAHEIDDEVEVAVAIKVRQERAAGVHAWTGNAGGSGDVFETPVAEVAVKSVVALEPA